MRALSFSVALAPLVLTACALEVPLAPSPALDDAAQVAVWVNNGSAPGAFTYVYDAVALVDGHALVLDASCPRITHEGATVTAENDCVDRMGATHHGRASLMTMPSGEQIITLEDFGLGGGWRTTGQVTIDSVDGLHSYHLAVRAVMDGVTTDLDYDGTFEGGYEGPTTWNGTGTITRTGELAPSGTVTATTSDEVIDHDACEHGPLSGRTTLVGGGHTSSIAYDGATRCDEQGEARWTLDGVDQGMVQGVACSASPGRGVPGLALGMLGLLSLAWARRRSL